MTTIGSLFSGAGGLDLAVSQYFNADVAWHCENDTAASQVLAAHWPDTPNLGDITQVNWGGGAIDSFAVDILIGGYP